LINTEQAAKIASSRFGYIFGDLARLEFALVKLAMDTLTPYGFIPTIPPVMVKPEIMKGMGKQKFLEAGDAFYIGEDNLYLVGSSEHSIGPLHMDEILDEESLPRRYMGFSTCFRREAGSYGKDTKGILRVHQFDKVEMFSFVKPEDSEEEHRFLLAREEELLGKLKLPHQVMSICTGDMGFGDYRQFDVETWLPGQGKYRETMSCSNTGDFQSRGLNIKYRVKSTGESKYVHTLNATAFAVGRMLIAILENYQTESGEVLVPEVLRDFVGKEKLSIPR
ncbi:MAG TPA: serine--tRNA ligase, partial [Candidatus Colwellbacteria bacterium]|nr:serine--tRNA ligase [Candidatus Colwellbacteria bacterium]